MGRAVADEDVSLGEIQRNLSKIDKRLDGFVTIDAWTRENDRMKERIAETDKASRERDESVEETAMTAIKDIKDGKASTWVRVLQLASMAIGLLGAVWAAYITTKGIK